MKVYFEGRVLSYFFIFAVLLASGCNGGMEKLPAAQDLLDFFSTSCKNNNLILQRALSQTDALETTLKNLQKNDACQGIANILPSVQDKSAVIRQLLQSPTTARRLQAQEHVKWLTTALSQAQVSGDTSLRDSLALALIDAKLEYYDASSAEVSGKSQEERERLANGLTVTSNYIDQLLKLQGQLAYCAQENPYLMLQLASSALAVSGGFLQPQFGPAIMMAGNALNSLLNFARTKDIGNALRNFDSEKMDVALPCVLESVASTYCESRNFIRILDFSNNGAGKGQEFEKIFTSAQYHQQKDEHPDPFLRSLRLLTYKVPDLIGWIRKVSIGVTPNDSFSADRVTNFIDKYADMQIIRKLVEGVIGETKFQLDQGSGEARESITRIGLRRLVSKLFWGSHAPSDHGGSTPISEAYNYARLVYRLAQDQEPPSNSNEQLPPELVELKPAGLTFSTIADRAIEIVNEVGRRVSTQLTAYNITNASKLLSEAREIIYGGSWEPVTVVGELIAFLYESEDYHKKLGNIRGDSAVSEIQKTRSLLEYLATVILSWDPKKFNSLDRADEEAKKIIEDLFQKLILIYGENYLAERIVGHIRSDLINRMLAGEAPKGIREILWASSRDIIRALVPASEEGQTSRHDLRDGLLSAMQVSMGNAKHFVDVFQLAFIRSMQRLAEKAKINGEKSDQPIEYQPHLHTLSQMCILLLTTSNEWPNFLDPELCKGTAYQSIYQEIPPLKYDDLVKELQGNVQMPDRFCKFNQYRQSAELARRNLRSGTSKKRFFSFD